MLLTESLLILFVSLFHLFQAVEGAGLAFIVYSEAIKNMPLPQLWSVLYFFMLLLLGMGSMLGNVTAIITPLRDFKVLNGVSIELMNGKFQADIDGKRCHHHSCVHQLMLVVYRVVVMYYHFTLFVLVVTCSHTLQDFFWWALLYYQL